MKTGGNARAFFVDVLPTGFVQDILELMIAAWARMKKPDRTMLEPRITALLRDAFVEEYEEKLWSDHPPFFVFHEHKLTDPDTGKEVARTDLEVYVRNLNVKGQKPYFVFESKKLNIDFKSGFDSNASEYVGNDGMMCFVTGKYGSGPSFVGMVGYVLNGDIAAAHEAVQVAMRGNSARLCMRLPYRIMPSPFMSKEHHNGETQHVVAGRKFTVFHVFLPF